MAQASQLSPELARGVLQLSRALLTATRNWILYPPEHPAVGQSLDRLGEAIGETSRSSRSMLRNGATTAVPRRYLDASGVTRAMAECAGAPGTVGREACRQALDRRRTPEMPALAPIVAFEHHLKHDLSGYPEKIGSRKLNLCTMIVSIADVFDALRSNRPYRQGLATARIRAIMGERDNPAFNQPLLKRFVNLMGLYPVGNLVRMNADEFGVVTAEHPSDPFRPRVKLISNSLGEMLEEPQLANTRERDSRGEYPRAVVEALDPEALGIDPLKYL